MLNQSETPTPASALPIPGGAAAGVVPDIATVLQASENEDLETQVSLLETATQQLRHALDTTRS